MAKSVLDAVLDAAHNEVANNANALHACSAAPTTRAEAIALSLGSVALDPADFAIADAPAGGRRLTVAAQTVAGSAAGTANHLALIDGTRLLRVTECTAVGMANGQPQDFKAFSFDIGDPV